MISGPSMQVSVALLMISHPSESGLYIPFSMPSTESSKSRRATWTSNSSIRSWIHLNDPDLLDYLK